MTGNRQGLIFLLLVIFAADSTAIRLSVPVLGGVKDVVESEVDNLSTQVKGMETRVARMETVLETMNGKINELMKGQVELGARMEAGFIVLANAMAEIKKCLNCSTFQCPNGYKMYEGEKCGRFCYRYESSQCQSWSDARQTCQNEGGDLMVPSECTYPFFREQASLNKGSCSHFWIGGRTDTPGSNYVTVKGDVIPQDGSFSYWSSGQPDGLGGESCLEMRSYFNNYLMNDYHCQVKEGFICQIFP